MTMDAVKEQELLFSRVFGWYWNGERRQFLTLKRRTRSLGFGRGIRHGYEGTISGMRRECTHGTENTRQRHDDRRKAIFQDVIVGEDWVW